MAQELYLKPAAAFVRGQCQNSSDFDLPTLLKEKSLHTLSREELMQICDLGQRRDYLRQKRDFIWNATNVTFQMRQGLIDFFASHNARIRIIYLEAPWQELISRNQHRTSPVPVSVIDRLVARLDVPTLTEAHRVDWIVSGL